MINCNMMLHYVQSGTKLWHGSEFWTIQRPKRPRNFPWTGHKNSGLSWKNWERWSPYLEHNIYYWLYIHCFNAVVWVTGKHSACKSSATTIPISLILRTSLTWNNLKWSNSRKMGRLNKKRVCVCVCVCACDCVFSYWLLFVFWN